MDEYVKPRDVADRLGVSRQAVYKWLNEGRLRGAKFGKTVRVLRSSIEEFERKAREELDEKNAAPGLVLTP